MSLAFRLRQILAICKKNMRIYYTEPPVLIFGLLFPFVLFSAFAMGRGIPPVQLVPGLLGITLFFTGSSVGPFITPWETRTKTLEKLLSSPTSVAVLVLGDVLAAVIFGVFVASFVVALALLGVGLSLASAGMAALNILLSALCFGGLGTMFSAMPTDKPANVMMLSNAIRLPVIFISGIFIPLGELPEWGRVLSYISPVTYTTDLMRYAFGQDYVLGPWVNVLAVAAFGAIFLMLSVKLHDRTARSRI